MQVASRSRVGTAFIISGRPFAGGKNLCCRGVAAVAGHPRSWIFSRIPQADRSVHQHLCKPSPAHPLLALPLRNASSLFFGRSAAKSYSSATSATAAPKAKSIRLVVNLENAPVSDPAFNVRAFVLHDKTSAQRFPLHVPIALPLRSLPAEEEKCQACEEKMEKCVVTTHPLEQTSDSASQKDLWKDYALALDGWLCKSCSAVSAPRTITVEEWIQLEKMGIESAQKGEFQTAEYFLRRGVNGNPAYPDSRINMGSCYVDMLEVQRHLPNNEVEVKRLRKAIQDEFSACLLPTVPQRAVPAHVYLTLGKLLISEEKHLEACKILARMLDLPRDFPQPPFAERDLSNAQKIFDKAVALLEMTATREIRGFAYFGYDPEVRKLKEKELESIQQSLDSLTLIREILVSKSFKDGKYGPLPNVDSFLADFFSGKALQVLDQRAKARDMFRNALNKATGVEKQQRERRIDALLEYVGDFLNTRDPDDQTALDEAIKITSDILAQVDDETMNVATSLGLLHLVSADLEKAEPLLREAAGHPKQEVAKTLLQFVARVKRGEIKQEELKRWKFTKIGHNLSFKPEEKK